MIVAPTVAARIYTEFDIEFKISEDTDVTRRLNVPVSTMTH